MQYNGVAPGHISHFSQCQGMLSCGLSKGGWSKAYIISIQIDLHILWLIYIHLIGSQSMNRLLTCFFILYFRLSFCLSIFFQSIFGKRHFLTFKIVFLVSGSFFRFLFGRRSLFFYFIFRRFLQIHHNLSQLVPYGDVLQQRLITCCRHLNFMYAVGELHHFRGIHRFPINRKTCAFRLQMEVHISIRILL